MDLAHTTIDELIRIFFSIFDNRDGRVVRLDALNALFVPDAVIVKKEGEVLETSSLARFIRPRQALFDSGELVDFHEWETRADTARSGNLACRHSHYRKQGFLRGMVYSGGGEKSFQLVRVHDTWKIVSVTWEDAPMAHLDTVT